MKTRTNFYFGVSSVPLEPQSRFANNCMKLTIPQFSNKSSLAVSIKRRSHRVLAVALCILELTSAPTYAGPVGVREVIQTLTNPLNPPVLQLRNLSQYPATAPSVRNGQGQGQSATTRRDGNGSTSSEPTGISGVPVR